MSRILRSIFQLRTKLYSSALLALCFSLPTAIASSGITYQGRILKPNGTPVTSSNVQFRMQIRSPGNEDCLLYEEVQNHDLSTTSGMFAISLGDGTGTRTDSHAWTLFDSLSNRKDFSLSPGECALGTSFSPDPSDNRRFRVLFKENSSSAWESLPVQAINFIPMSVETYSVGGFTAKSLLRVEDGGNLIDTDPLTGAQYNEILNLMSGTSSLYAKPGELGGGSLPTLNDGESIRWNSGDWEVYTPLETGSETDPTVEAFAKTSLPTCASGEVLFSDGSTLSCVTDAGTGTLPNVGTPGTYTKVTTDAQGRVTNGNSLDETDIPALTSSGNGVDGGAITTGTIGGSTSINTTGTITASTVSATSIGVDTLGVKNLIIRDPSNANMVTIKAPTTTPYTMTLPTALPGASGQVLSSNSLGQLSWTSPHGAFPTTCSASQTMTYSSVSDTFSCVDIAIDATQVSGLDDDYFKQGGNSFGGAATLGTDDANSLSIETDGTPRMTILSDGKVGIGTTTPEYTLHVEHHNETAAHFKNATSTFGTLIEGRNNATSFANTAGLAIHNNAANSNRRAGIFLGLKGAPWGSLLNSQTHDPSTGRSSLDFGTNDGTTTHPSFRMRIDPDGNVGIGTANPSHTLEVAGSLKADVIKSKISNNGGGGHNIILLYVDPTSGSDSSGDGSLTSPYATITKALDEFAQMPHPSVNVHVLNSSDSSPAVMDFIELPGKSIQFSNSNGAHIDVNGPISGAYEVYLHNNHSHGGATFRIKSTEGIVRNVGRVVLGGYYRVTIRYDVNDTAVVTSTYIPRRRSSNTQIYFGRTTLVHNAGVTGGQLVRNSAHDPQLRVDAHRGIGQNDFNDIDIETHVNWVYSDIRTDSSGRVGIGTAAPSVALDVGSRTDAIRIPNGTAGQQPTTPLNGMMRYNTSTNRLEAYENGSWKDMIGGTSSSTSSVVANDGSVAAPSVSFSNDPDTGFYSSGADSVGISVGGNQVWNINSSGIASPTAGGASIASGNGTATAPTFSFAGDEDTGWFRPAVNTLAAATGGNERVRIDSNGNVGIGTNAPATLLDIRGPGPYQQVRISKSGSSQELWIGSVANTIGSYIGNNAHYDTSYQYTPNYSSASGISFRQNGSTEFWNDSGLTAGTNYVPTPRMVIRNTGAIGIGTTTPNAKLQVAGDATIGVSGTNAGFGSLTLRADHGTAYTEVFDINFQRSNYDPTGTAASITFARGGATSDGQILFKTNNGSGNIEHVRITQNGRVGIGTTEPSAKLTTVGGATFDTRSGGTHGQVVVASSPTTAGQGGLLLTQYTDYEAGTEGFKFYNTHTGTVGSGKLIIGKVLNDAPDAVTPLMSISSSGNVGIGTIAPSHPLDVNGDLRVGSSAGVGVNSLRVDTSNGTVGIKGPAVSDATLALGGDFNNAARLRFYGSAISGLNRYTDFYSNGSEFYIDIHRNTGGVTTRGLNFVSNANSLMKIQQNGRIGVGTETPTERFHIVGNLRVEGSTDCTLGNGSGGTSCSSDIRLKKHITPIESPLEKILQLKGVDFEWNNYSSSPGKKAIGVIAQDVEKVFPTAVIEDKTTGYKKVDYAVLVAPLIESTKELYGMCEVSQREIAALKEENQSLKERLSRLEKEMAEIRKAFSSAAKLSPSFE